MLTAIAVLPVFATQALLIYAGYQVWSDRKQLTLKEQRVSVGVLALFEYITVAGFIAIF